ncbi:uncharacterized protein LOC113509303 isoform X2 [Galleria mellonella]|uniref:Uncharacterized protein LOC113509303 isoform X2 n=1 Tax=Galleria mellonella TaxID=7137 RepID=A0A6J1W6W9_GALME|nr:uncharacterized protein LOC113509303 isoform X2 [Galleria mellonella]
MNLLKLCYMWTLIYALVLECISAQESTFELPVQLFGFPFIILAVRLTNFIKKLSYALNPATYRSRNRRQLSFSSDVAEPYDVQEVEKYIVGEFGARACVFERVCAHYAARAQAQPKPQLDWPDVFSQYKRSTDQAKEFYLLSVFLGDIVGSPQLCHQLGKRRGCDVAQLGA